MKLAYPAIFTPDPEYGGYTVTFPDLPGCVTQGDTLAEAIFMAEDAASGWILDDFESGIAPPKPSPAESFQLDSGSFVNIIALDMDSYAEKYGSNAVRKNVTIPAWLNTMAEKNNVNFSSVLQDGLKKVLELN